MIGGCSPFKVNVVIGASDRPVEATPVLADPGAREHESIALIDLRGVIVDGRSPGVLGPGSNPVDEFLARLRMVESDDDVRAVVVRINSPGGTVTASNLIYEELRGLKARTGKPIVVSMGEVAASGGYYVALAADEIVASPMGITGSIGVIIPTVNVSDGLGRIGIVSRAITSGPNKDLANPLEPMEEEDYRILQSMVDQMYARFRSLVLERRPGASAAETDTFADGRVFTGERAVELGLADSTGGLREAFERARSLAGLDRARLIKLHDEGRLVRSAYALGEGLGGPGGSTEINLLGLDLVHLGELMTPRAYYLWWPGTLR